MLLIGHRGAKALEPENTLRSFRRAIDLGVDMIELDVHICKSGEVVVLHDSTLLRTTRSRGFVGRKTLMELKKLNAGKGECIPTLAEVIEAVDRKAKINIELKGKGTAAPVAVLLEHHLHSGWKDDDFLISSFNHNELVAFHALLPKMKIGVLFNRINHRRNIISMAEKLGAYSLHLSLWQATRRRITAAKNKGLKVFVYTVNKIQQQEKLKDMNVDGIFTDNPLLIHARA